MRPPSTAFEAGGPGDRDVLTELPGELRPLLLELQDGADSLGLDEVECLLAERLELLVLRDRLRLAPDRDDRAAGAVVGNAVADEPLGRRAVCALRGVGHALLAE